MGKNIKRLFLAAGLLAMTGILLTGCGSKKKNAERSVFFGSLIGFIFGHRSEFPILFRSRPTDGAPIISDRGSRRRTPAVSKAATACRP